MELLCHLYTISSRIISSVTYLLLKGSGDQAPQFREAAVDAVPAPFLYDLKNNDKNVHIGTSSQVINTAGTSHHQCALMDTDSHFPSQQFVREMNLFLLYRGGNQGSERGSDLGKVTHQGEQRWEESSALWTWPVGVILQMSNHRPSRAPTNRNRNSSQALEQALEAPAWHVTPSIAGSGRGLRRPRHCSLQLERPFIHPTSFSPPNTGRRILIAGQQLNPHLTDEEDEVWTE